MTFNIGKFFSSNKQEVENQTANANEFQYSAEIISLSSDDEKSTDSNSTLPGFRRCQLCKKLRHLTKFICASCVNNGKICPSEFRATADFPSEKKRFQ